MWILDLANGAYNLSSRVYVLMCCDRVVTGLIMRDFHCYGRRIKQSSNKKLVFGSTTFRLPIYSW